MPCKGYFGFFQKIVTVLVTFTTCIMVNYCQKTSYILPHPDDICCRRVYGATIPFITCIKGYYWSENRPKHCQPCSYCEHATNAKRVNKCIADGMALNKQCVFGMVNVIIGSADTPPNDTRNHRNIYEYSSTTTPNEADFRETANFRREKLIAELLRKSSTGPVADTISIVNLVARICIVILLVCVVVILCYFKKIQQWTMNQRCCRSANYVDCQSGNADETGNLIGAAGTSECSIECFPQVVYEEICEILDAPIPGKDWKTMAGQMGYRIDQVRRFKTKDSPTDALLLDWGTGKDHNSNKLIEILKEIGRYDAIEIVQGALDELDKSVP